MSSILACTLYLFKNRSLQEDRFFGGGGRLGAIHFTKQHFTQSSVACIIKAITIVSYDASGVIFTTQLVAYI